MVGEDKANEAGGHTPPNLVPGGAVAGGRYRLLAAHGGGAGLRYWQARDLRLGREVALVFVDPSPQGGAASAAQVLDNTLALSRLWAPGLAGVLDVVRGKVGGIVVAEWTPGRPLAAAAKDRALADHAATTLRPLVEMVKRVHASSTPLGLVGPDQIRITPDGQAVLAFPGVAVDASESADVKTLGAVLYALQTGTWPHPLPAGAEQVPVSVNRLPAAEREGEAPVDPQRRGASPAMAALAMRTMDGRSVSSAATVLSLLDDDRPGSSHEPAAAGPAGAASADGAAGVAGSRGTGAASASAAGSTAGSTSAGVGPASARRSSSSDDDRADWDEDGDYEPYQPEQLSPEDKRRKQQRQWTIMAVTGAAALLVVVLLLINLMGGIGRDKDEVPLSQKLDALQQQAAASRSAEAEDGSGEGDGGADAPVEGETIQITSGTSWQPSSSNGQAENAAQVVSVFDGDTSTSWRTDTYNEQFGDSGSAFKPGLGLLLTLSEAAQLTKVTLTSPDTGVQFSVRAVDSDNPTSLDDTRSLAGGTTSGSGPTTVEIDPDTAGEKTQYVLIWITKLAGSQGSGYSAEVQEVQVEGAK